jgi:cyclophilin family peptidyl-prolyl cis-trans isomerase
LEKEKYAKIMKRKPVSLSLLFMLPLLMAGSCSEKTARTPGHPEKENTKDYLSARKANNSAQETHKKESNKESKMVIIKTDHGDMKVRLYDETPLHRDNFLKLAEEGFYDGLLFHRVIQGFMIQGGDPDSRAANPQAQYGVGGPGYTIPAEIKPGLIHKKGVLAAARMGDQVNPKRESSGSQFYLVQGQVYTENQLTGSGMKFTPEQLQAYTTVGGTPHLDGQYTVFGEVIEGIEVIDKIAAVQTRPGDRPVTDVKMRITPASK